MLPHRVFVVSPFQLFQHSGAYRSSPRLSNPEGRA